MIEPKNIDRLFQEKLKDVEAHPPAHLWRVIESKMEEKKKRRILPFWYKFAGVAALIVLGLGSSHLFQRIQNPTTNIPLKEHITVKNKDTNTIKNTQKPLNLNMSSSDNSLSIQNNSPQVKPTNHSQKTNVTNSGLLLKRNDFFEEKINLNASMEAIPDENDTNEYLNQKYTEISQQHIKKENSNYTFTNDFENFSIKIDSTEVARQNHILKTNALEELLNEKEALVTLEENLKEKWSLQPSIAPIFLQASNSGSPLDEQFSRNAKTFETTISLGLGISYAVTNKFSIRSGVHKLELAYNTHDIVIYANFNGTQQLPNINQSKQGATMVVANKMEVMAFANQSSSGKNEGYLNHRLGYLEMPIEASYNLFYKKFDISLIGGLSTVLLTNNTITAHSEGFVGNLGSANNLNNVHFTSNVGIGIRYQFLKSMNFNFEPTLKYQINTFSHDSGNFRPYFFGLYSGVSYRF
jgi:hypothetical protein